MDLKQEYQIEEEDEETMVKKNSFEIKNRIMDNSNLLGKEIFQNRILESLGIRPLKKSREKKKRSKDKSGSKGNCGQKKSEIKKSVKRNQKSPKKEPLKNNLKSPLKKKIESLYLGRISKDLSHAQKIIFRVNNKISVNNPNSLSVQNIFQTPKAKMREVEKQMTKGDNFHNHSQKKNTTYEKQKSSSQQRKHNLISKIVV